MRVAFAGTPQFAAIILDALASSRHQVELVISQPDAPSGRGRKLKPPPVAELARAKNLPLLQPGRIGEVAEETTACDVLVVAAYGQILRPDTLYAVPYGAWNVHASLLPRYRGAAPIERAIMEGESETGVTIIQMEEGLDTGPMALKKTVPISKDITGGELTELIASAGAEAIVEVLDSLESRELTLTQQDGSAATYAHKLTDKDLTVDWGRSCEEIYNQIRALAPHIGARSFHTDYTGPVKLWSASLLEEKEIPGLSQGHIKALDERLFVGCGEGVIELLKLQLPGKRPMLTKEFLRGNALYGAFNNP